MREKSNALAVQLAGTEGLNGRAYPDEPQAPPDPVVRWRPVSTLVGDLMKTAEELAYFWTGETTPPARRAMYYRYEKKDLPGAFKYSGTLCLRRSTALALIWAAETKTLDEQLVKLAALNLQLRELATSLSDPDAETGDLKGMLGAALAAIELALVIQNPPPYR
jgi:hypothetical protein